MALPGLGNLYLILLKDTALVSLITLEEIMRKAQVASNATKEPFTFYMTAALIYLGLTVFIMAALHYLERRAGRGFVRTEL
ncbi:Octopine transport system permease protein OccQ [compost metagenome]